MSCRARFIDMSRWCRGWDWWQESRNWNDDWWRDPWQESRNWNDDWWRDPGSSSSSVSVVDDFKLERAQALRQHGPPRFPGAWDGGSRPSSGVTNYRKWYQKKGQSFSKEEITKPHSVFRVDVPLNLKECGYWWKYMKEYCALEDSLKISMRVARRRKEGKGWYTITVQGPGGYEVLEFALKELLRWRPDF